MVSSLQPIKMAPIADKYYKITSAAIIHEHIQLLRWAAHNTATRTLDGGTYSLPPGTGPGGLYGDWPALWLAEYWLSTSLTGLADLGT